jgi:hypothetical protein
MKPPCYVPEGTTDDWRLDVIQGSKEHLRLHLSCLGLIPVVRTDPHPGRSPRYHVSALEVLANRSSPHTSDVVAGS